MASTRPHHPARHTTHRPATAPAVVAPTAVAIGTTFDGYALKGYPTASSIKRIDDNTLKQTRTAFFRNIVAAQPIVRRGVYDFVLRPDVFGRLQTEAPTAATAVTMAAKSGLSAQSLPSPLTPNPAIACAMPGAILPDGVLADAATALHQCGLITVQGPDSTMKAAILATPGKVSFAGLAFIKDREGGGSISDHLYWPHKSKLPDSDKHNASGVTLGLGYDMKLRSKEAIASDLTGIGLDQQTAAAAAEGYHRTHGDAHGFADANRNLVKLTDDQQMRLLTLIIGNYEATVLRLVQADMAIRLLVCEFDALVSMNYQGALGSGVLLPVKTHQCATAAIAIVSTTSHLYADRRRLEQALFNRAVYNASAAS